VKAIKLGGFRKGAHGYGCGLRDGRMFLIYTERNMPKRKLTEGEKTSVEIVRMDLVKEKLARTGESLKSYLNRLIREDMMRSDEDLSIRYFKE